MRPNQGRNKRCSKRRNTQGFMILEVLIALLIFSLGVLGLVGLQSAASKQSGESRYRADAVLLANELVGMMWAGDHSNATLTTTYGANSTDPGYVAWQAKVAATLPMAGASAPQVTLTTVNPLAPVVASGAAAAATPDPSTEVQITISWHAAGNNSLDSFHNIVVVTQIK